MANEVENDDYEIKYEVTSYSCTAYVWFNGSLVETYTEYSLISSEKACADAKAKARQFVQDRGGQA